MKLLGILQGKWLGHPLHPALVHLPVGAWIVACALDAVNALDIASTTVGRLAFYCVVAGLVGALFAFPTGLAEFTSIKRTKPAWKLAVAHMTLNGVATTIWIINLALRLDGHEVQTRSTLGILSTSIIGAVLLVASGHIGSLMAFDQGIGVGRFSKKKWRKVAAEAGSNLPEEK